MRYDEVGTEPSGASFSLGETWPDWWGDRVSRNEAITGDLDGSWSGGPDFAEIRRPDGSVIVKKFGQVISPEDFLAPVGPGDQP